MALAAGAPSAVATYRFGGSIKPLSSDLPVWDHSDAAGNPKDACVDDETPDSQALAFRDSSNRVEMLIPNGTLTRRIMSPAGGSLNDLQPESKTSCQQEPNVFTGKNDGHPDHFQASEYPTAPYSFPAAGAVYAIVHNEYHGRFYYPAANSYTPPGGCGGSTVDYEGTCNMVSLTQARWSASDGSTFQFRRIPGGDTTPPTYGDNVVASIPYQFYPTWGKHGIAGPTNVVYNANDGYFYTFAFTRGVKFNDQNPGVCLLRNDSFSIPPPWEAFAGYDSNGNPKWTRMTNPYTFNYTNDPAANHVCTPIKSRRQNGFWQFFPRSLTFNTYLNKWMLVGANGAQDVVYSISDNLLDWSDTKLLVHSPTNDEYRCIETNDKPIDYPSILDPTEPVSSHTGTNNFEAAGETPYLYVERNATYTKSDFVTPCSPNDTTLVPTNDRDYVRFKIDFNRGPRISDFEPSTDNLMSSPPYGFDKLTTQSGTFTRTTASPPNIGTAGQNVGSLQLNGSSTSPICTIAAPCATSGDDDVLWRDGDPVSYGAWFYLPSSFYTNQQADVGLLQWDNASTLPVGATFDYGGVVLGSDHQARLVRGRSDGSRDTIGAPFSLPTDTWVKVWVVQVLSTTGSGAVNYVYWQRASDSQPNWVIANAKQPNAYGRLIDRMRFGIVANGAQPAGLNLQLDCAGIAQANC